MKELAINGNVYKQRLTFIKEDGLWECSFVDSQGIVVDLDTRLLACHEESAGKAKKELEKVVKENGLKYGVNNELTLWKAFDEETRKRILLMGRSLKTQLRSEWHSAESLWEDWSRIMKERTGYAF